MIQIMILILVFIAILINRFLDFESWTHEILLGMIWFILFGLLGTLASIAISSLALNAWNVSYYHDGHQMDPTQQIYALGNRTSTNGSFFLGSGYINTTMKYFYMTKTKLGLAMKSVNVEDCFLKEDSTNSTARIIPVTRGNKRLTWWGIIDVDTKYIIHIPPNSIKRNFNVKI